MAGLYIHIPFCHAKCAYCDFYSVARPDRADEFTEALLQEYDARRNEISQPETIYIGGGTPSSLPVKLLDRIMNILPLGKTREITMEVNPEDVTGEFTRWLASSPVNRVSMGVQSLNDMELEAIGRRHSAAGAINACHTLREAGISNLSLDLIFGLPSQTVESWNDTLTRLLELKPEHLSAYALMLEKGTRLWAMRQAGKLHTATDEDVSRMYSSLCSKAAEAGYEHYEISNFARKGYRSIHNSSYWNLTPYLGLGPGAHSFDGEIRRYNPGTLTAYLRSPRNHTVIEEETQRERVNDYIMVRLRTSEGLSIDEVAKIATTRMVEEVKRNALRHIRRGYLVSAGNKTWRIPEKHFLVADTVISDLMLLD